MLLKRPTINKLFVVAVRTQAQAIGICREFVDQEDIQAIILCSGFTHSDIAEISEMVGKNVRGLVARGDGPSNRVSIEVMRREGYFSEK
ncbi:hypothetical protein DRQ15_06790, partial [candidate division KSB1 bacterium]